MTDGNAGTTGTSRSSADDNIDTAGTASDKASSDSAVVEVTSRAANDNADATESSLAGASPASETQTASETQATPEPQFASPAQPQAMSSAANPEATNLKAAVAQNKKRSRRHLPMIVLIALALALATSVAYAAYRAYTDILLPQQQEQQRKEQIENSTKEAENAYSRVIEEYSNALEKYQNNSLNINDVENEYPHVNSEALLNDSTYSGSTPASSENYSYAVRDLNGDEVPELLIGKNASSGVQIYDMWSYQNGNLVRIALGMTRDMYGLMGDGTIVEIKFGGADTMSATLLKLNNCTLSDINQNYWSNFEKNWTVLGSIEMDRIDGAAPSTSGSSLVKYAKTDENGATESGTCTVNEFYEKIDEIASKHREGSSAEWKSISVE